MSCAENRLPVILLMSAAVLIAFAALTPAVVAQPSAGPEVVESPGDAGPGPASPASADEEDEKEKTKRHLFRMWAIVSLVLILLLIIVVIIILLWGRRLRWRILGHDRKVRFSKMEDLWWHKPGEDEEDPPHGKRDDGKS